MKHISHSILIILLAACLLLLPLITLSAPAATGDSEYSFSVSHEDRSNVKYALEPCFDVKLDATYGDFDTNKDGVNDFTGIAVDMRVTNISTSLPYGLAGIDGRLCFDNTLLDPLYKTSAELNGSALNPPPTVTNFPTYRVKLPAAGGIEVDIFSIDVGLCKAYAHTDGSYINPGNTDQIFTGPESYISCNYVINVATHVAFKENNVGLVTEDNVTFRYYFKVLDENASSGEFTFTVPDSPDATMIGSSILKAPRYTGGSPSFTSVPGRGDSVTLKLWKDSPTTPEHTPAPIETTPAPVETTPAPVETTPAPVETTPAPVETTPAPVETTPAPVETTPAPVETTPAPIYTTNSSDDTASPPSGEISGTPITTVPDDIISADATATPEPDAPEEQTTSSPEQGGSCGSFTSSAVICVLIILPLAILALRTVKSDENENS